MIRAHNGEERTGKNILSRFHHSGSKCVEHIAVKRRIYSAVNISAPISITFHETITINAINQATKTIKSIPLVKTIEENKYDDQFVIIATRIGAINLNRE